MAERSRGRPPKFPPEVARARVFDAARATLRSEGLSTGLETVTLEGCLLDADVPRGAANRLWPGDDRRSPQESFRHDLMTELLRSPEPENIVTTSASIERIRLEDADSRAPTAGSRIDMSIELLRRMGEMSGSTRRPTDQRLHIALRRVAEANPARDANEDIAAAIADGERTLLASYRELFSEMASLCGLRVKAPFTIDDFTACAYSVNEGLANRIDPDVRRTIELPSGESGETREWTLVAVAQRALLEHFFEPIDT